MIAAVLDMLRTAGLILLRRGWLMALIYAAGAVANYALIQGIGRLGAYSDIGGLLLMPLPILAHMFAIVGMLLVARAELRYLGRIAPLPADRRERRAALGRALLGGIVPFFTFYLAWGYLANDWADYLNVALLERETVGWMDLAAWQEAGGGEYVPREWGFEVGEVAFSPLSVGILVGAFALKWALGRWGGRFGAWATAASIYLEGLWVLISALILADLVAVFTAWVDSRAAMVWLHDITAWIAQFLAPLAWAWESLLWLVEQAGVVLLLPAAWLAIAGTVYGQAVKPHAPQLAGRVAERWRRLDGAVKRWLLQLWEQIAGRFTPLWNAILLAWRAGPVLIASYAFLNTLVDPIGPYLSRLSVWLWGPHAVDFWRQWTPLVDVLPSMILETVTIALAAAAYDAVLQMRALREAAAGRPLPSSAPLPADVPPRPPLPGDAAPGDTAPGAAPGDGATGDGPAPGADPAPALPPGAPIPLRPPATG